MQTKDFTISLDMIRTLPFRPFEVVEGDTGNVLHVTLLNDGTEMSLADCSICLVYASSAGFAMQDETSGVTKTGGGSFTVALRPAAYGAGNVSADVQVYSGENNATLVTSARFDFRCRKSLVSGEIIRANQAYPPLIEAARAATEAAATALAASRNNGDMLKSVYDPNNDGKVDACALADTATRALTAVNAEKLGGEDASYYAAAAAPPNIHALRHAIGGTDVITASSIGAEKQRLQFTDTSIAVSAWAADTTYEDYGFRASVALTGVLATMTPEVVFGLADATSGIFAPVAECYAGGVSIYASETPEAAITIPTIICWKAVG